METWNLDPALNDLVHGITNTCINDAASEISFFIENSIYTLRDPFSGRCLLDILYMSAHLIFWQSTNSMAVNTINPYPIDYTCTLVMKASPCGILLTTSLSACTLWGSCTYLEVLLWNDCLFICLALPRRCLPINNIGKLLSLRRGWCEFFFTWNLRWLTEEHSDSACISPDKELSVAVTKDGQADLYCLKEHRFLRTFSTNQGLYKTISTAIFSNREAVSLACLGSSALLIIPNIFKSDVSLITMGQLGPQDQPSETPCTSHF